MKKSLFLAGFIAVGLSTPLQANWLDEATNYVTQSINEAFSSAPITSSIVSTTAVLIALIGIKKHKKKRLKNRVATGALKELSTIKDEGNLNPRNVVLLWDLHGVSSKPNYPGLVRGIWDNGAIWSGMKASVNPTFWKTIRDYRSPANTNRCYEPFFDKLSKIDEIKRHRNLIMGLIHEQRPVPEVIELITQIRKNANLKANILFTNNGAQSHHALMQKQGYTYLNNFDHTFLAQGISQDAIGKLGTNVTALQATKPHAAAFTTVRNAVKTRYTNPTIILIDDKVKNVVGARTNGIHAILFQSKAQLERDLKALGLYTSSQEATPSPSASSSNGLPNAS